MTRDDFQAMLETLAEGWTSQDYESVIACFSQNIFYADPMNYVFSNSDALLGFFQDDDGRAQRCQFHNAVFDETRQLGAAEYTYEGTYRYHGTVWVDVKDGKITRWREYQHRSEKNWEEFWKLNERDRP